MTYCPVCHFEMAKFVDDDNKFVEYKNLDLFVQMIDIMQTESAKLSGRYETLGEYVNAVRERKFVFARFARYLPKKPSMVI